MTTIWVGSNIIASTANADNTYLAQRYTATAGQTVFTLTVFAYQVATGSLIVEINGVAQFIGVDFTETSNSSVTFVSPLELNDIVVIRGFIGGTAAVAAQASAAAASISEVAAELAETNAEAAYAAILALALPNLPLNIASGGTGQTTKAAAFIALAPTPEVNKVIGSSDGVNFSMLALPTDTNGLSLLATLTPTVSVSVDFLTTFTSTYDNYLVLGEGIVGAASQVFTIRFANTGVVDTGSVYQVANSGSDAGAAATSMAVTDQNIKTAGAGCNFVMHIMNVNATTQIKSVIINGTCQDAASAYGSVARHGVYTGSSAISGIRFLWSGGTTFTAQGKIRIFGYQNS